MNAPDQIINLKVYGLLTGCCPDQINLPIGSALRDLQERLSALLDPQQQILLANATILVNGHKSGLETILQAEDQILILSVLGGG